MYHQTHRMDILYPLSIWVQRNFNDLAEMSTAPQGHSAGNTQRTLGQEREKIRPPICSV